MFGLKSDWILDPPSRYFTREDYQGGVPRWCVGCGDHAILEAVLRICKDEQLVPEKTVAVAGIGCSSRIPGYTTAYGFNSVHGRSLPMAVGVKMANPELTVLAAGGDGDGFHLLWGRILRPGECIEHTVRCVAIVGFQR